MVHLIQLITALFLITAFLVMAGRRRAIFESILLFDTVKFWFGERFSRKAFTDASKDTNNDGRVSYLEKTFPSDGGHRTKLKEVLNLAGAFAFLIAAIIRGIQVGVYHQELWITQAFAWSLDHMYPMLIIAAAFWFLVYSFAFDVYLKKYREPPKTRNDFVAYDPPTLPIN